MFLLKIIDIYVLVVLASVIVSWIHLPLHNPVVRFCKSLTDPILTPIRSVIPTVGGLDFSPFVLLIGLQILRRIIQE